MNIYNGYLVKNGIFVKKDINCLLPEIDTIIFDVDGVLVNVDESYHKTIADTVYYYFSKIIDNVSGSENLVDNQVVASFKMAGGFNDDWELTAAIILFYIWKMKKYRIKSMEKIRKIPPLIMDFVNKDLNDGGGLPKLIYWITQNTQNPDEIFTLWDKEKIFQIAMEYYAGEKKCYEFYNFHSQIIHKTTGNIEKETIIIERCLVNSLKKYHVGILSGRNRKEANFIMEKIGWAEWLNSEMIVTSDEGMKKPSPEGLKYFIEKYHTKLGLYIGDTMDDLLTVKKLNKVFAKKLFLSGMVIGGDYSIKKKGKKNYYLSNDVDLLAGDVNQIVRLVSCRQTYKKSSRLTGG